MAGSFVIVRQLSGDVHKDLWALLFTFILEHLILVTFMLFELNDELTFSHIGLSLNHVVVIAVGTVLISFLELPDVFAERLLALFTHHDNVKCLLELVVLLLFVAVGAVVPLPAARRANGYLRVINMLAHLFEV